MAAGSPDSILAKMCVMSDMGINVANPRTVFRRPSAAEGCDELAVGEWSAFS